ncbi:hypothetical protein ERJ75_001738200 [Trypanosoma vivax]|uniref:Uncharacterized protein n=1 Tax=Trypanosoma vivax (strain Y486) TaxID=1055687 RepID=F9WNE2_TRYVY|nr:hypothetical protein TRVL_02691 [Trypanosoma vivax]KAH8604142.1 hypothetical protein ERJ75_001738200 [Trypanosoma vivax]CCD19060.1 hypothetical protein, conserved [Trypanosoma vivax Y486]|eukprot:CCD19060.1 hypothetical protein, conserved [Trypanosoma vivax Y486]
MDNLALSVSSIVHRLENFSVPLLRSRTCALAVALGIPVAVFLHDTANYWMPTTWQVPILSWFRRRWLRNPEEKYADAMLARNVIIFLFVAMAVAEGTHYQAPVDYVSDRVCSTPARKALTECVLEKRRNAFAAAGEVIGEEGLNEANARQQRDTALHRRFLQESRAGN